MRIVIIGVILGCALVLHPGANATEQDAPEQTAPETALSDAVSTQDADPGVTYSPPPVESVTAAPVEAEQVIPAGPAEPPVVETPVEPTVEPVPEFPTLILPPCEPEDSTNCYWNAQQMGNGLGTSFVNIDGVYYYAEGN